MAADDWELGLQNTLSSEEGRVVLAEMLRSMYFLQTISDPALMSAHEGGVVWYERMYMASKSNTLRMIGEHFMPGGDG